MIKRCLLILTLMAYPGLSAFAAVTKIETIGSVFSVTNARIAVNVWLANTVLCPGVGQVDEIRIVLGLAYSEPSGGPVSQSVGFINYTALVNAAQNGLDIEFDQTDLVWDSGICEFNTGSNKFVKVHFL